MKFSIALTALALLAPPTNAQDAPAAAPGFSVKADGNWEMICHVLSDGDQLNVVLNSGRTGYSHPRLVRASCESTGHAKGDIVISIIGAAKCPFKGASEEACTLTAPKGRLIAFEFRTKAPR